MPEYTLSINVLLKDKASKGLGGLGKNIQNVGKVALGLGGAAVAGVGALGAGLTKLAIEAAPLEGIEEAFYGIAEASGVAGDEMLASMKKGSAGMITQRDLMEKYNLAAQLVGDQFANQLPDAMNYLGKVSAATGEDMGFMMDSLVRGVGRLSPMILDNLGIQVDLTEAYEEWAKTAGVAATSVIDNTKAIGKENDAISKLEKQLTLAKMRQAEFTDKTKASTRAASEMRIEELTKKLGEHRIELSSLEANQGKVVQSTEDLASSMTKAQQQEALMAQVMKKLGENTAAMPEVMGSAAQMVAELGTKFKDFKDMAGKAVLPILSDIASKLLDLAETALPWVERGIEAVAEAIAFFTGLGAESIDTIDYISEIGQALGFTYEEIEHTFFSLRETFRSVIDTIMEIVGAILELAKGAKELIGNVVKWAEQFISWKDVLIALGVAIASVVVPALASIVAAMAPIIATGVALIALVAVLRKAWQKNFLGIQDATQKVWEFIKDDAWPWLEDMFNKIRDEVLPSVRRAWDENFERIRDATQQLWDFIKDEVWPSLERILNKLKDEVIPAVRDAFENLWQKAQEFWSGFWGAFGPALERMYERLREFWRDIQPRLVEAWAAIQEAWNSVVDLWNETLKPALDDLAEALGIGGGSAEDMGADFGALVAKIAEIQLEAILNAIVLAIDAVTITANAMAWAIDTAKGAIDAIKGAVDAVKDAFSWWKDVIDAVKSSLVDIELPEWLTPGSPTPLELGIRGITDAIRAMPELRVNATLIGAAPMRTAAGAAGGGTLVLAPVFLDPRDVMTAGGEIDYGAVDRRLRQLQGGI